MNKPLRCCNCNKVIAEEISLQAGVVKITCKCGTINEVKAEPKQSIPYGERQEFMLKGECGGPELVKLPQDNIQIPIHVDTSAHSVLNTRKRRFI